MVATRTQQEPSHAAPHLKWKVVVALLIIVGVAVQVWAAGQWTANFDSDEATFALMARHVLHGEVPTFVYGNRYLGSAESILAAPFLNLFGNDVFVFRISTVMLFALFLALHALLVTKWFGWYTATFSLLFLVFPGWRVLWWTFRPIGPYISMFVLGTTILLLGTSLLRKSSFHPVRLGLLGFVTGFALWIHQMTIPYILALAVAFLLQAPEWKALTKWVTGTFGKAAFLLPLLLVATLLTLFTLSFFSSSCSPPEQFALIRSASALGLVLIAATVVAALFAFSGRRQLLFKGALLITAGIVLGITPLWANALLTGELPAPALWPSCPTGLPERLRLLTSQLLPGLFGLPLAAQFPNLLFPHSLLLAIILLLIGTAVLYFVWQQRHALSSLLTLNPLPRFEPAVALALLFLVPISLAALGSNTIDVLSIRYLLVTWQASAIILGLFLAAAGKRSSALTIVLVGLWVFQLAVVNLRDIDQQWDTRRDRFSQASIAMLERTLQDAEITSGYADYWTAYALDYLTEERITLTPYNGVDRYPPYTEHVIGQSRIALIFPGNLLPEGTSTIQEVQHFLSGFTIAGPAFPEFHNDMANRRLQQRLQLGRWEVWFLENINEMSSHEWNAPP